MGRCVFAHRLAVMVVLLFGFGAPMLSAQGTNRDKPPVPAPARHQPESQSTQQPAPPKQNPPPPRSQNETEQFVLSHEKYQKAVSYSRAGYTLYFISYFLGTVVLVLILRLGVAAKFRDMAEAISDKRWLQCLVFVPLLVISTDILDLPVRIYWHALSLRYEQSIQRWGSWFVDWLKWEALSVGLTAILVLILYAVMRKTPRRWWFYFWLAALPILLFIFSSAPGSSIRYSIILSRWPANIRRWCLPSRS
jgi:STE24 endopeptidase